MKETFTPLDEGFGCVSRDSLQAVLQHINPDIFTTGQIDSFIGHSGELVSYGRFIDALFYGEKWTKRCLSIQGLLPPNAASLDERREVERAISSACLEFVGQFAGQYYPLPSSPSFVAQPGGMSESEQQTLLAQGLLFDSTDAAGRGIFANDARDVAVWVNADSHACIVVKQSSSAGIEEAEQRLGLLEAALRQALQQDGFIISA